MIPESRKLKRGLKDISPLFEKGVEPVIPEAGSDKKGFRLASLFSSDRQIPSSRFIQHLVTQLSSRSCSASRIILQEGPGLDADSIRSGSKTLDWQQFQEICDSPVTPFGGTQEISHTLFLEFSHSVPEQFEKVVSLLDQWILVVRPEMESLSEAYRMIKTAAVLNNHLEYFLLFDRFVSDEQASRMFEKFGEMVCRRLGVHLSWLGFVEPQGEKDFSGRMALEALFIGENSGADSIEKRAIAEFLSKPQGVKPIC